MPRLDPGESQKALQDRVQEAIQGSFPFVGQKHTLRLRDVEITNLKDPHDITAQHDAKMTGKTFGADVKATMELVNNETGKVVDTKKAKVATLPQITRRYSYIVGGSEHQVDNLFVLRPGVYTRVKQNGELESQVNVKGGGFHVKFDPESRKFNIRHGGAQPPLYPVMKALGVDDGTLEKTWGKDVLDANKVRDPSKAAIDFAQRLQPRTKVNSFEEAAEVIRSTLHTAEINPDVSKRTLGIPADRITPAVMLRTSERLLEVSKGDKAPDDRDALMFKELHGVEEFVANRIKEHKKVIDRKIGNNLDRRDKISDIVGPDLFNKPIRTFFQKSSLAGIPEQTNPLNMIIAHQKTTIMGDEGGIKSAHRVTDEAKLVNPSHFGFLDPLHTPESERAGVVLHTTLGVHKDGTSITIPVYNMKTGKMERVDPGKIFDSTVVMPDEVEWKQGKPHPKSTKVKASMPGNEVGAISFKKADYVMPSSGQVFSLAMNLVPFLGNNSQNRATMSGRHQEQAVSLKHREAPLVRSVASGKTTYDDILGSFTAQTAPVAGTVTAVKPGSISIETADGKTKRVPVYNNFPLTEKKGMLDSTPVVAKGDKVKEGDLIADTSFTKGGVYAPGINLRVAYVPARGYNVEDGVVISESAATKLTSEHMHKKKLSTREGQLLGVSKYKAHYPTRLTVDQAKKLDDDGIIRVGQAVEPGDTLVAAMSPRVVSKDEHDFSLIHKSLVKPYKDKAVTWEEEHPGKVVAVYKRPKGVEVHVRTEEPAVIGDKIVSRHANKGVISAILPDHEMPRLKTGEVIDVLHNPIGVPGRMNVGQVLETAASKVAVKTGKPVLVNNFALPDARTHVEDMLKQHRLSDKEPLIDPKTGKEIPPVLTGMQYTLKLHHQVDTKNSVRSRDSYDRNLIPKGGGPHGAQSIGALELYGLLAHGARSNIREMATYKADRAQGGDNDALWGAIQAGELLPPPRPTFAYNKFISYLKAAGVNVEKDGNSLNLSPLTDKQTLEMSSGEIKDGGRTVKMGTLEPEKGGLFDPKVTGGEGGTKWAHIALKEPMPNPIFARGIMSVSGIRKPEYERIIEGQAGVTKKGDIVGPGVAGAKYGPSAVEHLLDKVDVRAELEKEKARIGKLKGQPLDEANKRIKFLTALDKLNMKPTDAYMMNHLPVLPPAMRPISVMDDGSVQFDDLNHLYKQISLTNQKLGTMHKLVPDEEKAPLRAELYDQLKAYVGVGGSLNRTYPGILDTIAGGSPKEGYYQEKLVKKRQDLTMRSTIVPEPSLSLDEIGIPRKAAMELYKPFVVRELKQTFGMNPLEAQNVIKEDKAMARKALEKVVADRPIIVKRDPVLHQYGVMGFKPRLIEGKAIKIHPLVTAGFNADFDGDQQLNSILTWLPTDIYNADVNYWGIRRVSLSARMREVVALEKDGELVVCDLSEFPHLEDRVTRRHIDFHPVPDGVKVVAMGCDGPVLAEVSGWSFHHAREVEIVTLGSGRQIITDDDPRAVFGLDASSLEWERKRPSDSRGQFVPVLSEVPSSCESTGSVNVLEETDRLRREVRLDFDFGYFLGCLIGDGWVTGPGGKEQFVCFSSTFPQVLNSWKRSSLSVFKKLPTFTDVECTTGQLEGSKGSSRSTISCAVLSRFVAPLIGHLAGGKHLPPFFLGAPREFKRGLLSGLWDTDGSMSWSEAKEKLQFMCSYSSRSLRLVREVQHLLRTLGVSSKITSTSTPAGEQFWMLGVSTVELYEHRQWVFSVKHPGKLSAWEKFASGSGPDASMAYSRYRLVPLPSTLAKALREVITDRVDHSLYVTLSKAIDRQYVSKEVARRVMDLIEDRGGCCHPLYPRWRSIACLPGVHFERVVGVEKSHVKEDGYDLTVPGYETFMATDGVILSNTMSAFVPVTKESVEEVRKMMPSNMLFNPATGKAMYTPIKEMQVGLYSLAEVGKTTKLKFNTEEEVEKALRKGDVSSTDVITLNGVKTTPGRVQLNATLPTSLRGGPLLKDLNYKFTKKEQEKLFNSMAKADPKTYPTAMDKMKDLGNEHVFLSGFSIGLEDLKTHSDVRTPLLREAEKKTKHLDLSKPKDAQKHVKIYEDALVKMEDAVKKKAAVGTTNLDKLETAAGIKGNAYRQLTAAPVLFTDAQNKVVLSPVTKSYAEGMDIAGYWSSMSGGRKGVIQKVQSVAEPGYLSKLLMNVTMNKLILGDDCGTTSGISLNADEPDVVGRYTQASIKLNDGRSIPSGTLLTPDLVTDIKNSRVGKVVVRSPLKCNHAKGICPKCYGLNADGKLHDEGTNIGVLAAQSLGERGVQLSMRRFHSGGVHDPKGASLADKGLERADELLKLPQTLKGSAVLATSNGTVTGIDKDPAGGWNVKVENKRHYVPADRPPQVKVGDKVKKGLPITAGPINPHDMLPLTGIGPVQNYITDELHSLYAPEGIRRRNTEVVVKAMSDVTKVEDPGDHPDFIRGDLTSTSMVQHINKTQLKGMTPIKHVPILKGIRQIPQDVMEDWLARLNHEELKSTVIEGAQRGWKSNIHGEHPVPGVVYGAEFGLGESKGVY